MDNSSNNGCWIKFFNDGEKEVGSDRDIQAGKASWTCGRQKDITEVLLFNGLITASLSVPNTNWYQFDRYITNVNIGIQQSIRTCRVIQAQINKSHLDKYIIGDLTSINLIWTIVGSKPDKADFEKKITKEDIDKWITIGLPYNNHPFIVISTKGKI